MGLWRRTFSFRKKPRRRRFCMAADSPSSGDAMGPARRGGHTTPAGVGIRSPERAPAGAGSISGRTPVPYLRTKNANRLPDTRLCEQILPALSVTLGKIHILKKIPVSRLPGRQTSRQIKTPLRKGLTTEAGFCARYSQEGFIPSDATALACHRSTSLSARYPTLGPKNGDVS